MIKLIVVAGSSSDALAKFFEKRGTFEIVAAYDTLTDNVDQIQNKVVIADRLLYLYNDRDETGMNIKSDMQILSNLLKNDSFFKPGEIVFMTSASDQAKLATKFFVTVMKDNDKSDYSIKTIADTMSFVAIYNLLMGTSGSTDFKNSYTTLYKVERNAEDNIEYPPADDRDLLIEPFGMDSVIAYADKQKAVKKADTGTIYTDSADTELIKNESIQIDQLPLKSILSKTKYILISGLHKSGKSMWAAQLAISAANCNLSTCVIDFTENSDIKDLLVRSNIKIDEVSFLQMLRKQTKEKELTYVTSSNKQEAEVSLDFIQVLLNQKIAIFDAVFIVCEPEAIGSLAKLFIEGLDIVMVSNSIISDIGMTMDNIPVSCADVKQTIILNKMIPDSSGEFMEATDVRTVIPAEIRVVKDKHFTNFNTKGKLFSALFGD